MRHVKRLLTLGTFLISVVVPGALPAFAATTLTATVSTGGGDLNERSSASTQATVLRVHANGARLAVVCQVYGVSVAGHVYTTSEWDKTTTGGYVTDSDMSWGARRPVVPWCGTHTGLAVTATVRTPGGHLNVRSSWSTSARLVGTEPNGASLAVTCQIWGQTVTGTEGTTATWDRLSQGRYVSEAYVQWHPDQPVMRWCGEQPQSLIPSSTSAFITSAISPARASMHQYTIPASVTIAQAILESGWGRSTLTRFDHNYFGMKCFGDPGPIAIGCRDYATHECNSSGCFPTTASFRAYVDATQSYADHGRLLGTVARYHAALQYVHDPDRYAIALQQAGYATSPTYAANLISLMRRYDLYRYDISAA